MSSSDPNDPRALTLAYMDRHHVTELIELLLAEVLIHKPDDPRAYVVSYLEKLKAAGTQHFLEQPDLEAMFGLFDATNTGSITTGQADNALKTVLGSRFSARGNDGTAKLDRKAFVVYMSQQLKAGTPYAAK